MLRANAFCKPTRMGLISSDFEIISIELLLIDLGKGLLVKQLERKLPSYMLPRSVRLLHRFPLNTNGKYDRKALQIILEKGIF